MSLARLVVKYQDIYLKGIVYEITKTGNKRRTIYARMDA